MAIVNSVLTDVLDQASLNKPGAIKKFYEELLGSTVFVPVAAAKSQDQISKQLAEIGGSRKISGYLELDDQGHVTIPIFSESEFVAQWAEQEIPYERVNFSQLIWKIDQETWLYLNPAQEVGKELSPWEIKHLQRGKAAAGELAAELGETQEHDDIEIKSGNDLYPEVRTALLNIIEVYDSVEAAFLVEVKERGYPRRPLLGLSVVNMSDEKKQQLREELIDTVQSLLPAGVMLGVVDDLANQGSPNTRLFEDATPFYFAQKRPMASQSFLTRLLRRR